MPRVNWERTAKTHVKMIAIALENCPQHLESRDDTDLWRSGNGEGSWVPGPARSFLLRKVPLPEPLWPRSRHALYQIHSRRDRRSSRGRQ